MKLLCLRESSITIKPDHDAGMFVAEINQAKLLSAADIIRLSGPAIWAAGVTLEALEGDPCALEQFLQPDEHDASTYTIADGVDARFLGYPPQIITSLTARELQPAVSEVTGAVSL